MKKESLYDKADKHLQRVAKTIGAVLAIIGATTSICAWVSNQFQSVVSAQISDLREEIQINDKKTDRQITRLELLNLINTQPQNKAEIEKVARYYFITLGGDWYATGIYSEWAEAHGGDIDIIVGKD